MSNSNHHGMHRFHRENELCTLSSLHKESIGRFGRMFHGLPALYLNPNTLSAIGQAGGIMDGGNSPGFTDTVPLGMIYLGQFIDHDITFDTSSNFSQINNPADIENVRTANLDLDCIFGGGPEDEPFLYSATQSNPDLYLLTGETNSNAGQNANLAKEDLARTGTGTAIIGDPRNDENRIVSQLQLLFIKFYNSVYSMTKADAAANGEVLSPSEIYERARRITTWHYQWIVINEFLPHICGSKITKDVLGCGRKYYRPSHEAYIPVEFSIAAYRFGHSMIAQKMKLQSGGNLLSIFSPDVGLGFSPISNSTQIVDWSLFFDTGSNFQKAEKLDTKLASDLLNLPFVSGSAADKSLATRNLRRGQSFLMPSGETVARHMLRHPENNLIEESHIDDVVNYINTMADDNDLDLGAGIPLWLYILAEAEVVGRLDEALDNPGEGLGPVGATIVAEVIIGLLELNTSAFLGSNRDWIPTLGVDGEFTMKDLITIANTPIV